MVRVEFEPDADVVADVLQAPPCPVPVLDVDDVEEDPNVGIFWSRGSSMLALDLFVSPKRFAPFRRERRTYDLEDVKEALGILLDLYLLIFVLNPSLLYIFCFLLENYIK